MQKHFFVLAIISLISIQSQACDICGCSAGNSYLGVLPQFTRSFIGIKYQYQQFKSKPHEIDNRLYSGSEEIFQTSEFWGRWVLGKRLQLFGSIPLKLNSRTTNQPKLNVIGLGDVQLLANFILFQTPESNLNNHKHLFQAGVGFKLPTGNHNLVKNNLLINQNIQLGTGSIDIPLNFIYTYRYKKIGGNLEANYRFNGKNNMSYQFGNRMQLALSSLYWYEKNNNLWLTQLGLNFENSQSDKRIGKIEAYTGSSVILANVGCDLFHSDFGFGLRIAQPVQQRISENFTKSQTRISANFIYLFNNLKK